MTLIFLSGGACTAGLAVNSLPSTEKMEGDPLAGQRCQVSHKDDRTTRLAQLHQVGSKTPGLQIEAHPP